MFVSNLMVRALLAELEHRGLPKQSIVADARAFSAEQAVYVDGLRGREVDDLVRRALALSGDPALGLALGQQAPETMLHVLGHLLLASPTIRDATGLVRQYGLLLAGGVEWFLSERDKVAVFGFSCPTASGDTARFWADWMLALALRLGRHFGRDPRGTPQEVLLAHPAPSYADAYGRMFGCPVRFDQATNAIVFDRRLLDRVQPHADPMLCTLLRQAADDLYRQAIGASSFGERVRQALRYEQDLINVDFDRMASRWGLTRRTLRRKLSAEGLSLSELLDEACCRQAKDELRRRHESIKEIAERLGYSETSAFHRAFKRWTGQTPTEYRVSVIGHAGPEHSAAAGA